MAQHVEPSMAHRESVGASMWVSMWVYRIWDVLGYRGDSHTSHVGIPEKPGGVVKMTTTGAKVMVLFTGLWPLRTDSLVEAVEL